MASSIGMGLGNIALTTNVFKRKFRWTLGFVGNCPSSPFKISESFLKTAGRPHIEFDETEINFLNAKMWIPGKGAWQTMEVTYLDVATNELEGLWSWLMSVYNIMSSGSPQNASKYMGSQLGDFSATGSLVLWDGCGAAIEHWTLYGCWPKAIDFGELDMSSSEICEVKLTMRYNDVGYVNNCPGYNIKTCCTSCG